MVESVELVQKENFKNTDLFLRTLAGESTEIKPVWMMRQAGRYLPEYMKVRNSFKNFIEFYKNPEAACEVTMQPLRRFGLDAAILFSDILTLLPPMGSDLEFIPGRGPVVHNPVRCLADAQALKSVDVEKDLWFVGVGVDRIGVAHRPCKHHDVPGFDRESFGCHQSPSDLVMPS